MNWDRIKANLKQFKGRLKEKLGRLIHNDQTTIAGKREQLAGKLQEKYAFDKAQSEKELDEFAKSLEPKNVLPSA